MLQQVHLVVTRILEIPGEREGTPLIQTHASSFTSYKLLPDSWFWFSLLTGGSLYSDALKASSVLSPGLNLQFDDSSLVFFFSGE